LAGAAPSTVLEDVMQAVARSSSEEVLRLVDRLIGDGHSPTHFARQMVRFLRNTVVAKIAGGDSSLLQISGDERARVARVAELFSEEDLARHLQIMLRTHGELGYRQEQRFHLELGLLKMTHAQRLLPIEELLSAVGTAGPSGPRSPGKPTVVPDARKPESPATARSNQVSPFAADSARKSGSKPQLLADDNPAPGVPVFGTGKATATVVMGAAAPAAVVEVAPQISARPEVTETPPVRADDLDRDALADGRREIRPIDADLGKPTRRVAFELPIDDAAVVPLCVHEHDDVRIHPIHLGYGAFERDLLFHVKDRRRGVMRQQRSAGDKHGNAERNSKKRIFQSEPPNRPQLAAAIYKSTS
jgi:hypothetical protein